MKAYELLQQTTLRQWWPCPIAQDENHHGIKSDIGHRPFLSAYGAIVLAYPDVGDRSKIVRRIHEKLGGDTLLRFEYAPGRTAKEVIDLLREVEHAN